MTRKKIPLVGGERNAHQTFFIQLGEYSFEFKLDYVQEDQWMLSILPDGDSGDIPLVTIAGVDYVCPSRAIEPGGSIVRGWGLEPTFGQLFLSGDEPTLDNLGTDNTLVWVSPDEVLSL